MYITVSRGGEYFCDGQPCATISVTKSEDGKAYADRVPESERGFKHLTKCEDMVISQDEPLFASRCSRTHWGEPERAPH